MLIQTGGTGTLHAPAKQQTVPSYTPLLDERHLTAFVGGITTGDDEQIIQLLSSCGELRCWKRARDAYGKAKDFGLFVLFIIQVLLFLGMLLPY